MVLAIDLAAGDDERRRACDAGLVGTVEGALALTAMIKERLEVLEDASPPALPRAADMLAGRPPLIERIREAKGDGVTGANLEDDFGFSEVDVDKYLQHHVEAGTLRREGSVYHFVEAELSPRPLEGDAEAPSKRP